MNGNTLMKGKGQGKKEFPLFPNDSTVTCSK